ncbi:accessory Sec system translocase SecA2 [Aciduricibacillus chroicocephali]|uniref:Protein translocase subunit SecA n=1 Tax=Aciduricibacillus chroicocephali TaxID=3054939 RepID=A0ABY9KUE8_9BACI|nr:accessory Sec system translocase SecA2 [Bacillaceae bacterium 44XB]
MKSIKFGKTPKNLRELKPFIKIAEKVNEIEPQFMSLSDEELRAKTDEFKERLKNGETIHDLAPEAFATVREASRRVLGLRHFDVQIIGGLVLLKGNIAEMRTGEGKTLVATLPAYLVALEGKGCHVITVNDYLATRDRELMAPVHEFLGLTVGLNVPEMDTAAKKAAYNCDITYGVGTEFGFDLLRDNMVNSFEEKVQRPFHFAMLDEADSVLIDEAKTPLIIASKDVGSNRLYKVASMVVKNLKNEVDYTFDREMKVVHFNDSGIDKCEKTFGVDNLFDLEHSQLLHCLLQALRAKVLFQRDIDYIVDEGEIKLVDINTGRVMEGRSLSDGLHQAIESKEGLKNTDENKTHASITIQNYYRLYPHLSGMTGTAKTDEEEIRKVYGMDVINIPTNKTNLRIDHPDKVYMTKEEKYAAITKEAQARREKGQPVLIGTSSIIESEEIAKRMENQGIQFQLLNAKNTELEARLISVAGQHGMITIATNMAGRGTDIILGEGVAELGGLHVIGTERNESKRIDDQLKGRSARQGDPGSTQFIISLEDYLFERFATEELERLLPKLKPDADGLVRSKAVYKLVDSAQTICEGVNYQMREYNLKLEDVLNNQRDVMYKLRDKILLEEDVIGFIGKQTEKLPEEIIEAFCPDEADPLDWDIEQLEVELNSVLLPDVELEKAVGEIPDRDLILQYVEPIAEKHREELAGFAENEDYQHTARGISLFVIDSFWQDHLDTMQQLKEGMGLRQYQQEDPVTLFSKEGYELFQQLFQDIQYEMAIRVNSYMIRTTNDYNEMNDEGAEE